MALGVAIIGGGIFAREEHKVSLSQRMLTKSGSLRSTACCRRFERLGTKGGLFKIAKISPVSGDGPNLSRPVL